MLQLIRDRAQGILIWTIVGLIIVTFALFGLSSYLSDTTQVNVAEVNGAEISQNEFYRAYQNYQQRLQQMLGKNYSSDLFSEERLKKEVVNALVKEELLNQELRQAGYFAAPQQVMAQIAAMEVFQDADGKFSPERYKQTLNSQRVNSFLFEQEISRDVAEQHLRAGIAASGFVTESELQSFAKLYGQKRKLDYLVVPKEIYLSQVKPDDSDIDAYYESHKAEFMTPEQVVVEYVELRLDQMAKEIDVSEEEIAQYYEQQRANYIKQPEQRKASHILIKVDDTTDEASARQKISDIQAKLSAGSDFASLAKEYSDDFVSAKQGGDLGLFGRGVMDKAFEDAAFKLEKGQVSSPVRSQFGYHLIKLDDIQAVQMAKLDDVRDTIKQDMQMQQAEQDYYQQVDKLNNLSYEIPDSLTPVANELGVELKTSSAFSRKGGKDLFANEKVITNAFSEEVLAQGRNSQLIEVSDTHVMVLRVAEHKAAKQLEKQEVLSVIANNVKTQMATEKQEAAIEQALTQLKEGATLDMVAESFGVSWRSAGEVTRQVAPEKVAEISPQIRAEVFRITKPSGDKTVFAKTNLPNGSVVILALHKVIDGPVFEEHNKIQQTQNLIKVYSAAVQESMLNDLREQADVSINIDSLE
ncbi:MAG: SurA N-terminal domain-containing protein [Gammaproteobacteria bacterium]|nr:SurA N-terminal domain-containing protein [Gammaproteobacteria bacterium]